MSAHTQSPGRRHALYAGLEMRNRIVAVLRVGVPAAGLAVFLVFAAQIFLASLKSQFGIGKVSFTGDTVIVDTPSYSGVMADGDIYKVSAEAADTALTNLNLINLQNARLILTRPDGSQMTATASRGAFETLSQTMTVPGTAIASDSEGNAGTLEQVTVSLPRQTLAARGHVSITMADGTLIEADGLDYDAKSSVWRFRGRTSLTLPQTPGEDAESAP